MGTFKEWMLEKYEDEAIVEIVQYGPREGTPHLTNHYDLLALYAEYNSEMWERLANDAENLGYSSALELLAKVGGARIVQTETQLHEHIVWYAAERTAEEILDDIEAAA